MSEIEEFSPALLSPGICMDNLNQMIEAYKSLKECYLLLDAEPGLDQEESQAARAWLAKLWGNLARLSDNPMRVMLVQQYIRDMEKLKKWMWTNMSTMLMPTIDKPELIPAWVHSAPTEPNPLMEPPGFLHLKGKRKVDDA